MQEIVKRFVKICAEIVRIEGRIYEFGSLQVPGQEGFADLRPFFPGMEYIGCDMRAGIGVDRIEDLEKGLSMETGSASVVLCMDTLEHVFDVFKAIREMKRILKDDDGILIVSSVLQCVIHSYPFDYWRFTPQCFKRLLSEFDISLIVAQGDPDFPVSILGIGVKTRNKNAWRDRLNEISGKYEQELRNNFRYDNSLWRRAKLAFYKVVNHKKYLLKVRKTHLAWVIYEKND